jgi:hypothetical protein
VKISLSFMNVVCHIFWWKVLCTVQQPPNSSVHGDFGIESTDKWSHIMWKLLLLSFICPSIVLVLHLTICWSVYVRFLMLFLHVLRNIDISCDLCISKSQNNLQFRTEGVQRFLLVSLPTFL